MDYNKIIEYGFNLFVEEHIKNDDVKRFLKNHERLPKLVGNLSIELKKLQESKVMRKGRNEDKRQTVKLLIKDFSATFCKAALEEMAVKRGLSGENKNGNKMQL